MCVQCVVFSRWDEGCVGVCDKTVKLWDVTSGECLQTLEGHSDGFMNSVSFSPDGTKVASMDWDDEYKIWNTSTGECTFNREGLMPNPEEFPEMDHKQLDVNGYVGFHGFKLKMKDENAVAHENSCLHLGCLYVSNNSFAEKVSKF